MKKYLLLLLGLLTLLMDSQAQQALQTDLPLKYLVRPPLKKQGRPPLLILLHGYGSNEADLFELRNAFPEKYLIVAPQAPVAIGNNAYQWYSINSKPGSVPEQLQASTTKVKEFITAIIKKYNADPARIYLAGFSQGAVMSYEVGLSAPALVTGIGAWSGKLLPSLRTVVSVTAPLRKLRIFIGHGTRDDRIPYTEAVSANTFLKGLKLSPDFHTYNGMTHQINDAELQDFLQWLEDK